MIPVVEPITEKEEIAALQKLLREALSELKYRSLAHPSASTSSVLERGCTGLRITESDLT